MDSEWFIINPTLKQIALAKVMIDLWNSDHVRLLIHSYPFPKDRKESKKEWIKIEENVEEKVRALPLPKQLRADLIKYLYPIGHQIKLWWEHYRFENSYLVALPKQLSWTPMFAINGQETVKKMIVEDESRDLIFRYKFACTYCLEEQIVQLWKQLPAERQRDFYAVPDTQHPLTSGSQPDLVKFWTRYIYLEGHSSTRFRFLHYFNCSVESGNLAATRFFLERLTVEEQEVVLSKCWKTWRNARKTRNINVMFYLLWRMNAEQRKLAFKASCGFLLDHALHWSRYDSYLRIVDGAWTFTNRRIYLKSMRHVLKGLSSGSDQEYRRFFVEFWKKSPLDFRSFVIEENFPWLASYLCKRLEMEILLVVFEDVDEERKRSLIFDKTGMGIVKDLTLRKEWDFLRFFVGACVPSKHAMVEYKRVCVKTVESRKLFKNTGGNEYRFDTFLRIIDDVIREKD